MSEREALQRRLDELNCKNDGTGLTVAFYVVTWISILILKCDVEVFWQCIGGCVYSQARSQPWEKGVYMLTFSIAVYTYCTARTRLHQLFPHTKFIFPPIDSLLY